MSSVSKKLFGETKAGARGRKSSAKHSFFRLKVEGEEVVELIEFLELVYDTTVKVREKNGTVLTFSSTPNRSSSGIRVGLRLHNVAELQLQEW